MLPAHPPAASAVTSTGERSPRRSRRRAAAIALVVIVGLLGAMGGRLAGGPATPQGHLFFRGDFETGDFSQWSHVQAYSDHRYQVVRSPRRQGRYAARFESVAGECLPMDCAGPNPRGRTEAILQGPRLPTVEGKDLWYRWYTLFPAGGPVPEFTFAQWRANDERSGPRAVSGLYGLMTVGRSEEHPDGYLAFQRNGDRWTGPLRRGVWIKFLVHVHYSSNPDKGRYELWVDNHQVMSIADQSKPSNTGVYFKQGVYRNNGTPTGVVYEDGLRIASTRETADPGAG